MTTSEAPGASAPSTSSSSGSAAPATAPASSPGAPSSTPSQTSTTPSSTPSSAPASTEPSGEYAFLESLFEPPGDEAPQLRTEATVLPVTQQAALGAEPQQQPIVPQAQPTPQQGQQAPIQASTNLDPADPAAIANAMFANEAFMIDQVASAMFSMSPEDVGALETDFVGTIPKLLAKAVVKAQQQQLAVLSKIVPAMLTKYVSDHRAHSTNEAKFYARWPGLNPATHGPLVQRYAATYRQMHPNATLEGMIEDLGPMLYIAARVNPMQPVAPQNPTANGGRPPQAAFVPAGAGVPSQQSAPQVGSFDFLGQRE